MHNFPIEKPPDTSRRLGVLFVLFTYTGELNKPFYGSGRRLDPDTKSDLKSSDSLTIGTTSFRLISYVT